MILKSSLSYFRKNILNILPGIIMILILIPDISVSQVNAVNNEIVIEINKEEIMTSNKKMIPLNSCEYDTLQLPEMNFEIDKASDIKMTIKTTEGAMAFIEQRTPILIDCVDFTQMKSNGIIVIPQKILAKNENHIIDIILFSKKEHRKFTKRVILNIKNKATEVKKTISSFKLKPVGGISLTYQDTKQSRPGGDSYSISQNKTNSNIPHNLNFESVLPFKNISIKSNMNFEIKNNHVKSTNYLYKSSSDKRGISYGLQPFKYSQLTLSGQNFYGLKAVNKLANWNIEMDAAQIVKPIEGKSSSNGTYERILYGGRLQNNTDQNNKIGFTFYRSSDLKNSITSKGPFLQPLTNTIFGFDWKVRNRYNTTLDFEIVRSKTNDDQYSRRSGGSGSALRLNLSKVIKDYNYHLNYDQTSDKFFAAGLFSPNNNNQNFSLNIGLPFKTKLLSANDNKKSKGNNSNLNISYNRGKKNRKSSALEPSYIASILFYDVDLKVIKDVSFRFGGTFTHNTTLGGIGLSSDQLSRDERISLGWKEISIAHTNRSNKDRFSAANKTRSKTDTFFYRFTLGKKSNFSLNATNSENQNLFTGIGNDWKQIGLNMNYNIGKISPNLNYSVSDNKNSMGTQDNRSNSFNLSLNYAPAQKNSSWLKPNYSLNYNRTKYNDRFNFMNNYTTGTLSTALNIIF